MTKPYNGHHCWNCWNVSLWIANDEGLYRLALHYKSRAKTLDAAARLFIRYVGPKTPDGATFTQSGVRRALADLE